MMRYLQTFSTLLVFYTLTHASAYAYEPEGGYGYSQAPEKSIPKTPNYVTIAPRFEKFNQALKTLGIPLEETPEVLRTLPGNGMINLADVQKNLQYIDGFNALREYLYFDQGTLALYQDFYRPTLSSKYQEFITTLHSSAPSRDNEALMNRLASVAVQSNTATPLAGLKIALNPGHMGGKYWDNMTGKFVAYPVNGKKTKVSEGMLTLYTAFVLKNQLEALGATVKLTREGTTAVTRLNIENFDITNFRKNYIYALMDSWMSKFYQLADKEFAQQLNTKIQEIDQNIAFQRDQFFNRGEDLKARVEILDDFVPDLTLEIHFDAHDSSAIQSNLNEVKIYVAGGLMNNPLDADKKPSRETGSRHTKAYALKHLLEPNRWNQSVLLAQSVAKGISKSTGVKIKTNEDGGTKKVVDGVYSRNLYMTLHATTGLFIYLECLNYDYTTEFSRFAQLNRVGYYNGKPFSYPARIEDVANGIRDGILKYFSNSQKNRNTAQ